MTHDSWLLTCVIDCNYLWVMNNLWIISLQSTKSKKFFINRVIRYSNHDPGIVLKNGSSAFEKSVRFSWHHLFLHHHFLRKVFDLIDWSLEQCLDVHKFIWGQCPCTRCRRNLGRSLSRSCSLMTTVSIVVVIDGRGIAKSKGNLNEDGNKDKTLHDRRRSDIKLKLFWSM